MLYGRARYVIIHKGKVPVGCIRCCHWEFTFVSRGVWECNKCKWLGGPYTPVWRESQMPVREAVERLTHVRDRYYDHKHQLRPVGQYRLQKRRGTKNKMCVPVACPNCHRKSVEREGQRAWACDSCSWVGAVVKKTWVLVE